MSNLKKNFIYNLLYQILVLFLPLITVPYVSRQLGADGVGIYSYTYSIVYYFMLIALLGINNYGKRIIAKTRDDKTKMSKTFISIYGLQLSLSIVMILFYIIYIFVFCKEYKFIAIIQTIYLISNMFDINWFFFGIEEFKITISRSAIVKILSLILIFLFVKDANDVHIYTFILSGSTLISQLLLWPYLIKRIKITRISYKDIIVHLKPCLILFIPVIAVSLYRIMDKIMLGSMSNVTEVGYYEQSERIISISIAVLNALSTVMLPRIAYLINKGENEVIKGYIEKSFSIMMFLSLPISLGIIAVASDFVPIFFGQGFERTAEILYILSITIVFQAVANIVRNQYLLPYERDVDYIKSVIIGAIINLIINIILIPSYGAIGACLGTIAADFSVMVYQLYAVRKELPIIKYIVNTIPFLLKSLIMFIIVFILKGLNLEPLLLVILQIFTGIFVYFLLNIKFIFKMVDIKRIINKIKK